MQHRNRSIIFIVLRNPQRIFPLHVLLKTRLKGSIFASRKNNVANLKHGMALWNAKQFTLNYLISIKSYKLDFLMKQKIVLLRWAQLSDSTLITFIDSLHVLDILLLMMFFWMGYFCSVCTCVVSLIVYALYFQLHHKSYFTINSCYILLYVYMCNFSGAKHV